MIASTLVEDSSCFYSPVSVGPGDYITTTVGLLFEPLTPLPLCVNISVVDDEILEIVEEFFVQLTVVDQPVVLGLDSSTVAILNDDGKKHKLFPLACIYCQSTITSDEILCL